MYSLKQHTTGKQQLIAAVFILSSYFVIPSANAETADKIEQTYAFLSDAVEFKKFRTEQHGDLVSNVHYDFYRTQIISDLTRSKDGLSFNISWSIKQNLFDRNPDNTLSTVPRNKDRMGVNRCNLLQMKSTHEIIGSCHNIANSLTHSAGADILKLNLADGRLTMVASTASYGDFFATGDQYNPGRSTVTTVYYKNSSGHSVSEESYRSWLVNPATLERIGEINDSGIVTVIAE